MYATSWNIGCVVTGQMDRVTKPLSLPVITQLDRIIPGYTDPKESLKARGMQTRDGTEVIGEPDIV